MNRTDLLGFWDACLTVFRRHDPSLRDWRWDATSAPVVLQLNFAEQSVSLRLMPPGSGNYWLAGRSQHVAISGNPPAGGLPDSLDTLRQLVVRGDPGGLTWPAAVRTAATPDVEVAARRQPVKNELRAAELASELHWASFFAWQSVISEDLYPHVGALGEIIDTPTLVGLWEKTGDLIRNGIAPQKLGLYIHIPFCTVACTFCYCSKTDDFRRNHVQDYVESVRAQAELFGPTVRGIPFTSVYYGGGTPSLLTSPQMEALFSTFRDQFIIPEGTQVIYEGNPDSLSDRKIEVMAKLGGVTRLTIGVQTLDDDVQRIVKRFNKPEQVAAAVESARKWGITHVNTDLMAGLPGQTTASFMADLEFLLSLQPDSIHLNAYRPLPVVSLAKSLPDAMGPEQIAARDEMMRLAEARLAAAGHSANAGAGAGTGQGKRKTQSAANIQEYDLRRQNSSLLALGIPARGHAFGGAYYLPDFDRGFESAKNPAPLENWRWRAIMTDTVEEQHKYLVSNMRSGFLRSEFRELFGVDAVETHASAFEKLESLGAVVIEPDFVTSHTGTHADNLMYRVFLHSQAVNERARAVWGASYDPDVDYRGKMRELVEQS